MSYKDFKQDQADRCIIDALVYRYLSSLISRKRWSKPAKKLATNYRILHGHWSSWNGNKRNITENGWWDNLLEDARSNTLVVVRADDLFTRNWLQIKSEIETELASLDIQAEQLDATWRWEARQLLDLEREFITRALDGQEGTIGARPLDAPNLALRKPSTARPLAEILNDTKREGIPGRGAPKQPTEAIEPHVLEQKDSPSPTTPSGSEKAPQRSCSSDPPTKKRRIRLERP